MIRVSESWKATYPGATAGILMMRGAANPERHPALEARKAELELQLRARFAGQDASVLKRLERIQPYVAYYKRFGKSYHVQMQLESVALRGKDIPSVAALVEAMFLAELQNLLLTAGHDLAAVRLPVTIDAATGTERFVRLDGQEQQMKPRDMMMTDELGVISSVIYGPDQRTRITRETKDVLFMVYAPAGIGEETVRAHLEDVRANVLLVAPEARVETMEVFGAS